MTSVSQMKSPAICAVLPLKNSFKKSKIDRYVWKQIVAYTSKDDLDLLGDDVEAFSGSQADLEGAADNLFSSAPCPQTLRFETLSLKTPPTVPPTPCMALQNKIESKLEKAWVHI